MREKATGTMKIVEEIEIQEVSSTSVLSGLLQKGDIVISMKIKDKTYNVTRNFIPVDACLNARVGDNGEITVSRNGEIFTYQFQFSSSVTVG